MRITAIDLYSADRNIISFNLNSDSYEDKYLIKAVIGLDADEILPKFYSFGTTSRAPFYNMGLKAREVVIRAQLNPDYLVKETFSDIRDELYRIISANRTGEVKLLMRSGAAVTAVLSGFITKFEVPHMSNVPELQMTIRCDDGMLRGYSPVEIPVGILSGSSFIVADSISTAPHGFTADLTCTTASPTFTLQNPGADLEWKFEVTPDGGFEVGDVIHISSEQPTRDLRVTRVSDGLDDYLMDKISANSVWPIIFPGENDLYFPEAANFTWDSFTYYSAHWGV